LRPARRPLYLHGVPRELERRLQQPAGLVRLPLRQSRHVERVVLLEQDLRRPGGHRGRAARRPRHGRLRRCREGARGRRGLRRARLWRAAVPGASVRARRRRHSAVRLLLDVGEDRPALSVTREDVLALYRDGVTAFRAGDRATSLARNTEALKLARNLRDLELEALALVGLSRIALRDGDYARVRKLAGDAL